MAQFWGWVKGGRTSVSRTGGVDSGLDMVASGRTGTLHVHLAVDKQGREVFMVRQGLKAGEAESASASAFNATPIAWGFLDEIAVSKVNGGGA